MQFLRFQFLKFRIWNSTRIPVILNFHTCQNLNSWFLCKLDTLISSVDQCVTSHCGMHCLFYFYIRHKKKMPKGIIAGFFRYISDKDNYEQYGGTCFDSNIFVF